MSKIIAVTSGKGGTGKSSICSGLGYALAKQGHRTIIIELDFGLRCLDIMLGVKNDITYDLGSVLDGKCDIYKATTQVKMASNLSIVCAPEDPFAQLEAEQIKNICQEMRKYYEYIIVDTSAGISSSVFDIVEQSDLILIVTTPDPICVRDGRTMSDEFYKRGNKKQRLIINKMNRVIFGEELVSDLDEIIDTVGVQLIGVIPDDDAVTIATGKGEPIPSKSEAFIAFDAISKRIKGEDVPLTVKIGWTPQSVQGQLVQDMADQVSQLPKKVASAAANVAENAKNSGFKDKFIEQKDKFFNKITDLTSKFKK